MTVLTLTPTQLPRTSSAPVNLTTLIAAGTLGSNTGVTWTNRWILATAGSSTTIPEYRKLPTRCSPGGSGWRRPALGPLSTSRSTTAVRSGGAWGAVRPRTMRSPQRSPVPARGWVGASQAPLRRHCRRRRAGGSGSSR